MRSVRFAVLLAVVMTSPLMAQAVSDDEVIDRLLSQTSITWDNAAWLVGRTVEAFDENITPAQAADKAILAAWGPVGRAPDEPVDTAAYSQLLIQALKIPTGIMYSWFPGSRYAYRELVFNRLIPGSKKPDSPVSGRDAMQYLQSALSWKEARQ